MFAGAASRAAAARRGASLGGSQQPTQSTLPGAGQSSSGLTSSTASPPCAGRRGSRLPPRILGRSLTSAALPLPVGRVTPSPATAAATGHSNSSANTPAVVGQANSGAGTDVNMGLRSRLAATSTKPQVARPAPPRSPSLSTGLTSRAASAEQTSACTSSVAGQRKAYTPQHASASTATHTEAAVQEGVPVNSERPSLSDAAPQMVPASRSRSGSISASMSQALRAFTGSLLIKSKPAAGELNSSKRKDAVPLPVPKKNPSNSTSVNAGTLIESGRQLEQNAGGEVCQRSSGESGSANSYAREGEALLRAHAGKTYGHEYSSSAADGEQHVPLASTRPTISSANAAGASTAKGGEGVAENFECTGTSIAPTATANGVALREQQQQQQEQLKRATLDRNGTGGESTSRARYVCDPASESSVTSISSISSRASDAHFKDGAFKDGNDASAKQEPDEDNRLTRFRKASIYTIHEASAELDDSLVSPTATCQRISPLATTCAPLIRTNRDQESPAGVDTGAAVSAATLSHVQRSANPSELRASGGKHLILVADLMEQQSQTNSESSDLSAGGTSAAGTHPRPSVCCQLGLTNGIDACSCSRSIGPTASVPGAGAAGARKGSHGAIFKRTSLPGQSGRLQHQHTVAVDQYERGSISSALSARTSLEPISLPSQPAGTYPDTSPVSVSIPFPGFANHPGPLSVFGHSGHSGRGSGSGLESPRVRMGRRRAVTSAELRTCVLVQTKLKADMSRQSSVAEPEPLPELPIVVPLDEQLLLTESGSIYSSLVSGHFQSTRKGPLATRQTNVNSDDQHSPIGCVNYILDLRLVSILNNNNHLSMTFQKSHCIRTSICVSQIHR